jgi:putative thioredoxin
MTDALTNAVIEITDQTFEKEVLDRSKSVPVVVDFWAPWCGPCRIIGPVLEKLAREADGAWILAKLNTDENQLVAQAFQITGIPTVIAFKNGQMVDEFVGALPEAQIREFVERLRPNEIELMTAEGETSRNAGRSDAAEAAFKKALELDRDHGPALLGLARLRADQGRTADALGLVDMITPGTPERVEGDQLAARLRISAGTAVDEAALEARIGSNPDDLEARYTLAQGLAAAGRYEPAFEQYLEIVRRDRAFREDAGRRAMVDLFQVLGAEHPLTEQYRSELGRVLFA